MFIVSFAIQYLLFLYFDAVYPSEIGVRRHPCFCFGARYKNKEKDNTDEKHE